MDKQPVPSMKHIIESNLKRAVFWLIIVFIVVLLSAQIVRTHIDGKKQAYETIEQVMQILEENQSELDKVTEEYRDTCLNNARTIAYMIQKDPALSDSAKKLRKVAKLLEVDEIHIFDESGVIVKGTTPKYYGYSFGSGDQMAFFKPLLKDKSLMLCQDITPNTVEGKPMQYSALWSEDGRFIVQVGMKPVNVLRATEKNELSYIFRLLNPSVEGSLYAIDAETLLIEGSKSEDEIGTSAADIGLDALNKKGKGSFYGIVNGKFSYCVYKNANGTILVNVLPVIELYDDIFFITFLTILGLGLFAVFLLKYATRRMESLIVDGIDDVNATLEKMSKTSDLIPVNVQTCKELDILSDHINEMAANRHEMSCQIEGQLKSENDRLGHIIQGLAPLFTRLAILDYSHETYEYLQGALPDLPPQGQLSDLSNYMAAHYISGSDAFSSAPSFDIEEISKLLGEGVPYLQYEYRIRWEDDRWENASMLSVSPKEKTPMSVILAVQDVTTLKTQEEKIQQTLHGAFTAAEDLSQAKSAFLARMSHDMRTPMNAVLGLASIALSHLDDEKKVRECLEKINSSGHLLLDLINEALDMSKLESGGMVLHDSIFCLSDKLNEVASEILSAAEEKQIQLHIDVSQMEHQEVIGDAERLQQVLRNLLDNAVKYTMPGGAVTFAARELPSRTPKSGYYEFIVEDTGAGIPQELQPKIFEPFVCVETEGSKKGTGLGLPIAQSIVKLMNGDIKMESEPGRGSRFTVHVFLKLQEKDVKQALGGKPSLHTEVLPDSGKSGDPAARHTGRKILLVEDNEINMEIAMELLDMAGVEVETAENGAVAVEKAQSNPPGYYDLIFMDLQMPVMDGYEAARALRSSEREDLKHIPIVALSANAFQENVSRTKDAGMNDHVMKPVELDRLLASLDKWLAQK